MENHKAEKAFQIMQQFHKIGTFKKTSGELPRSELMTLKMIRAKGKDSGEVTISMLSDLLDISKPAVSQVINTLEDKGYVERVTTRNDRRLVYVRLTEAGEQCLAREMQAFRDQLVRIFDKMGEQDTDDFLRLLNKLFSIMTTDN